MFHFMVIKSREWMLKERIVDNGGVNTERDDTGTEGAESDVCVAGRDRGWVYCLAVLPGYSYLRHDLSQHPPVPDHLLQLMSSLPVLQGPSLEMPRKNKFILLTLHYKIMRLFISPILYGFR